MKKMEEVVAEFFEINKGRLTLYFPGLNRKSLGYETKFHQFAANLATVRPQLKIEKVGINKNQETITARAKDFSRGFVGNIYSLHYKGIIFLSRFMTWLDQRRKLQNPVYCLTDLLKQCDKGSGILAFCADEEINNPEMLERYMSDVYEASDSQLQKINQQSNIHYLLKAT